MGSYQGKISGVGNAITRQNEITADDLAILRNYIYGWEYGVINRNGWKFDATVNYDTDMITIDKGIMFAYGYFGILPESITIPFIKSSATQYRIIYAEIDRSVSPNTFKIKVKNNQGSNKIKPTTFRQDYLTAIKTGVFQLPLYIVKLNSSGIVSVEDIRIKNDYLKDSIKKVKGSDTTAKVTETIASTVTGTTQLISDNSNKLATTKFTKDAIRQYIDYERIYTVTLIPHSTNYSEYFVFYPTQAKVNKRNPTAQFGVEIHRNYASLDIIPPVGFELTEVGSDYVIIKMKDTYTPESDETKYIEFDLFIGG